MSSIGNNNSLHQSSLDLSSILGYRYLDRPATLGLTMGKGVSCDHIDHRWSTCGSSSPGRIMTGVSAGMKSNPRTCNPNN